MPEVIESKPICKQHERYIGWPTIAKAPDGTLHAVFSGDRDSHICPFGKTYLTSSTDAGVTWSQARVINDTPLDDRDAGLCIQPDGTMIISWFTSHYYRAYEVNWAGYKESTKYASILSWDEWEKVIQKITPADAGYWAPYLIRPTPELTLKWANAWVEMGVQSNVDYDPRFPAATRRLGYWTRRSNDGGKTWDDATPAPVMAPHGPNILDDGSLIMIGNSPSWYGDIGVAASPDNGLTWKILASMSEDVTQEDGISARLGEPHVVAAASGKLVGLARYQAKLDGDKRFLWQFDSEDGGVTWSKPRPTNLNGYPPHLLRTSDGRLLASFSVRHEPRGYRFCFSSDEGKTWDVDNQLYVNPALPEASDLGYPATAEVSPGNFVSVYYQKDNNQEKTCLTMTRWKG